MLGFMDAWPQPSRDPEARDDSVSFPLDEQDLSTISDQKIAALCFSAPKLHEFGDHLNVARISKSLVIKGGRGVRPHDSQNMVFAAETLNLPVPKVHRAFVEDVPGPTDGTLVKGHFIVMDYVPGPTVEECWDKLDETHSPRPTSWTYWRASDHKLEGPWFTDNGAGPFATLQDLEDWCNHKIDICIKFNQLPWHARYLKRFRFNKLVLAHQDIAPRNLILDAQGKVWLIDWGLSGVYPPGFEQARNEQFVDMVLDRLSDRREDVME
ncbi:kinase-like domain protein [Diplogelasinospora grovesii]|uniref:Kinase-like domain protein n=1 Tax=Diplogelasinospora grovesii TaxID=303347 RepID=A0AAN6S6Y9_9PEZI|nr:kinase-like domain protein [Diplogelasinospora grovesii]